ncbi:MAG: hypothetical protein ACXVRJ_05390 [Gaiellaceae bacterium]
MLERPSFLVAGCGLAAIVVVLAVAATQPTSGAPAVVAAVVLAPLGVLSAAATASRLGGARFAGAAAVVYVALPLLANRFMLGTDRGTFDRHALPALVGVQATWVFALGVAAVAATALLPERLLLAGAATGLVAGIVAWSPGAVGDVPPMLHETAYSVALAEWLVVATIAGAVLRRPFLGGALACAAVVAILRAAHQPFDDAGFWRALGPLVPAGAVLIASLGLLVPRLGPGRLAGMRADL